MIANASKIIVGSHYNYDYASKLNSQCRLIPSSVPLENYFCTDSSEVMATRTQKRQYTIGWIGSSATLKYLAILVEPLKSLAEEGYSLELLIAGTWNYRNLIPIFELIKITEIPYYTGKEIPNIVNRIDLGVLPLFDTDWEKGKSGIKALIYMAGCKTGSL